MVSTVRTAPFLSTSLIRFLRNEPKKLQKSIFRHLFHLACRVHAGVHNNSPSVPLSNAGSMRKKVLTTDSLDIVAMTDTWLAQNYLDCKLQL